MFVIDLGIGVGAIIWLCTLLCNTQVTVRHDLVDDMEDHLAASVKMNFKMNAVLEDRLYLVG